MILLSAENLTKHYGDKVLFQDIRLGLAQGDKVALVARNGTGKSTLLSVLAGTEAADSGKVVWRNGIRMGILLQQPDIIPHLSALENILMADDPIQQAIRQYELHTDPGNPAPDPEALQEALAHMDALQAWDFEARVKQVLYGLGLQHHLQQAAGTLSGGQQKRLALARLLLSEPDMLLLDEPTNHLDLDMTEWLEEWLQRSQATLLLVTHDRWFLDGVCNRIYELEGGQLHTYEGNYGYYLEKKAEREAAEATRQDKLRSYLRKELEWMRRQPKARTTKSKARQDTFHELSEETGTRKPEPELLFQIKTTPYGSKVAELKQLRKAYGDRTLLAKFSYVFKRGERVGLLGPNGAGKSTFLKLLLGLEAPDSGKVELGETIIPGYYRQDGLQAKPGQRVLQVVKDIAENLPLTNGSSLPAAQFLNRFGFGYGMHQTEVEKLSGGERRRLHLLTVLIRNPNLLILDEPTNDLDLPTLNLLEEFLLHYTGTLIIVSHDRYFLDRLVDHLLVFDGKGEVQDFPGNYQQWRTHLQAEAGKAKAQPQESPQRSAAEDKKPLRQNPTAKLSNKEQRELQDLDARIPAMETELAELARQLQEATLDYTELAAVGARHQQLQEELDDVMLRWMELTERS
ncbi:MAG: ABC-F family ATP-binding cassette domain-containing protein [Bacteroidetes bacterium]|nr:ABC-F family ATP-binding cassette domain-containing protein [Bacteroidota bacterium]